MPFLFVCVPLHSSNRLISCIALPYLSCRVVKCDTRYQVTAQVDGVGHLLGRGFVVCYQLALRVIDVGRHPPIFNPNYLVRITHNVNPLCAGHGIVPT